MAYCDTDDGAEATAVRVAGRGRYRRPVVEPRTGRRSDATDHELRVEHGELVGAP